MALRISLFKTPKHKVFNYKPIYYDPVKEEFDERVARIRASMETEEKQKTREERLYYPGRTIRGSFQKARYENRRHAGNNSYIRWVVLLSIVVLLVAIVYFADGLGLFFKLLSYQTAP